MATLSDMPWLGQPADPAGSLARGIQAGSMIAQNRNQRESLALRRMQFEAEQQERAAMMPLQLTLLQQDAQMKALKIEDVLKTRQMLIDNERFLGVVSSDISNALSEKDPYGAFTHWSDAASVNPKLLEDPRFMQLRKMVDDSVNVTADLMRAEAYRDYYTGRNDRAAEELKLKQDHEARMERQFQFRKEELSSRIPQHRQTEFRTKAEIIKNDINLIGNTEEKLKRLNDLVREFEATTPGASTMPTAPTGATRGQTIDIGRFKVTPIR